MINLSGGSRHSSRAAGYGYSAKDEQSNKKKFERGIKEP
jgi:hypothetical protein